jgi:hypothetical protein
LAQRGSDVERLGRNGIVDLLVPVLEQNDHVSKDKSNLINYYSKEVIYPHV